MQGLTRQRRRQFGLMLWLSLLSYGWIYSWGWGYAQAKRDGGKPVVTRSMAEYLAQVALDSNKRMVLISQYIPSIKFDLKYASRDNFAKRQWYSYNTAYLRLGVVGALAKAQAHFQRLGYGLLIWDAYRPYSVTVQMYQYYPNKIYLASPAKGSRHNRGCALDVTLIDLKTGQLVAMPTDFDSFSPQAFPKAPVKDQHKRQNRELLIWVMQSYGFKVSLSEWWHFDFIPWKDYELLDLRDFPEANPLTP